MSVKDIQAKKSDCKCSANGCEFLLFVIRNPINLHMISLYQCCYYAASKEMQWPHMRQDAIAIQR